MPFILGIGAQKSASTWLYHQLARSPNFVRIGPKEQHFWDRQAFYLDLEQDEIGLSPEAWFFSDQLPFTRPGFERKKNRYFSRIQRAVKTTKKPAGSFNITADITPAYAALPKSVWTQVKRDLEQRAIDYRIIFFMRDPVRRILSQFAMELHRGSLRARRGVEPVHDLDSMVLHFARSWKAECRSRYELTLANLDQVFAPESFFIGFHELMSSPEQLAQAETMLGLSPGTLKPGEIVHSAKSKPLEVNEETIKGIADYYASTYDSVFARFPIARKLWLH